MGEPWVEEPVEGRKTQEHGFVYEVMYHVSNLSPSSTYEITLLAQNEFGWSHEARISQFHINGGRYLPKSQNILWIM